MRAKLTYRFAPVDTGDDDGASAIYRGRVYGGDDFETPIPNDWREYLYSVFLHALRDVESDIRNWRRSPLRALLQAATAALADQDLDGVRDAMKLANDKLNNLGTIKDLADGINTRLNDMVGEVHALKAELAAAPDDPVRLIRGMRIYVDGDAHRNLASASLGSLNVLYLALLELGLTSRLLESEIAHVVMGIEEPEAHLHPHLQRVVFRHLLQDEVATRTVLVTTQSPHIASVADPRSLVALRSVEGSVVAASASDAPLSPAEWDDIRRYLDATRAELVFARKVLLVEGYAEQVLVPRLAAKMNMDLDKLGISVCAINGTHFSSYVQFCRALKIPWAVLTNGDPNADGKLQGLARGEELLAAIGGTGALAEHGIFVGTHTFEYDIVQASQANVASCFSTLRELCAAPSRQTIDTWQANVPQAKDFLNVIRNAGGKGRYALRLSTSAIDSPTYVVQALRFLERA